MALEALAASPSPSPSAEYAVVNPWTIVGPLVGALAVALISAASIQVASLVQHTRGRRANLTEVRRAQYFAGLEAADAVLSAMRAFGSNNSGRIDPADAATEEEAQEMIERDERAAAAVDRLSDESSNLHRAAVFVGAVGSPGVRSAMEALERRVDTYMATMFQDTIFRASVFNEFVDDYGTLLDALTLAVRADLGVDNLFVADRNLHPQR